MENQLHLFVVELENNKLFFYPSVLKEEKQIIIECHVLYEFIRSNPIKSIIQTIPIDDYLEIDKTIKKYMFVYGVENIRGGTYMEQTLSNHLLQSLEEELQTYNYFVSEKHKKYDEIFKKYDGYSKEELHQEQYNLQNQIHEYEEVKAKYDEYRLYYLRNEKCFFDKNILNDLKWLKDFIEYRKYTNDKIKDHINQIYKDIIVKFKFITMTSFKIKEEIDYKPIVHLYHPEFILDEFFYHRKSIKDWDIAYSECIKYMDAVELMCYRIFTILDDYECILSYFPKNFEEESKITMNYLEYLISSSKKEKDE